MAAIATWKESNGAGEVVNTAANLNFGSNDSYDLNTTTYPIVRGGASYEKYLRCLFSGTWTVISNLKWWKSSGTLVTGETIKAATNQSYTQPVNSANGDSDIPTSEGTALTLQSMEGAATIVYGASGVSGHTKYMRLQLQTTGSTPSGAVNQKTITLQYDEM